jgi:protein-S-isoprenylcysteine O-methyltransferase Ste14
MGTATFREEITVSIVKSRLLPFGKNRHHWSDWAGFVCFTSLAVLNLRQSMMVGFMLLPVLLHEEITALSFLLRQPAKSELRGWTPRVAAYAGTFFVSSFILIASAWRPGWLHPSGNKLLLCLAYLVWVTGVWLSVWTTWRLRQSFSLIPQAREIVTSGPYRLARHPIYTSYIVEYVGFWLAFRSLALGVALLIWFGLTLVRIHYEELVLARAFPEYAEYRLLVGMFGPRLFSTGNKVQQHIALLPKEKFEARIPPVRPGVRPADADTATNGLM